MVQWTRFGLSKIAGVPARRAFERAKLSQLSVRGTHPVLSAGTATFQKLST